MNRRGDAGAAAERVFEVDRAAVLLEEIAERFVRQLLKILHLGVAEKIKLAPGLLVELHAFARHPLALFRSWFSGPVMALFCGTSTFWPGKSIRGHRRHAAHCSKLKAPARKQSRVVWHREDYQWRISNRKAFIESSTSSVSARNRGRTRVVRR